MKKLLLPYLFMVFMSLSGLNAYAQPVANPVITIGVKITNITNMPITLDGDIVFVLGNPDHNGNSFGWEGSFNFTDPIRFSNSAVTIAAGETKTFYGLTWKDKDYGLGMGEKSPLSPSLLSVAKSPRNVLVYVDGNSETVLCGNMDPNIIFREGGIYDIRLSYNSEAQTPVPPDPYNPLIANPVITIGVSILNNTGSSVTLDGDIMFVMGNPDHNGNYLGYWPDGSIYDGVANETDPIRFSNSPVTLAAGEERKYYGLRWLDGNTGMGMGEKSPLDPRHLSAANRPRNVLVYVDGDSETVLCDNMDPSIIFRDGESYTIRLSSPVSPSPYPNPNPSSIFYSEGINYEIGENNTVSVISDGMIYSGDVVIPEQVNYNRKTYSVTRIAESAFYQCSNLTNITIPSSVTSIGNYAFRGCIGLTSIIIPNSVTFIGSDAFRGCSSLMTIISEIETPFNIFDSSFSDNTYSVAELIVPKGTKALYQNTEGWKKFSKITESSNDNPTPVDPSVANPVITIAVNIVNNTGTAVTLDGDMVFVLGNPDHNGNHLGWEGSYNYTDPIRFSNSAVTLGAGEGRAFYGLTWREAELGAGMGEKSPLDPSLLAVAKSPRNVMVYVDGNSEVVLCDNMDPNIIFEDGGRYYIVLSSNTSTSSSTFYSGGIYYKIGENNTVSVISGEVKYTGNVVIPEQVTYNGKTYSVTRIGYSFSGCSGLTSVTIPNSVTYIPDDAFLNCSNLTSVAIGNGVTYIDRNAFKGCNNLISVYITDLAAWCKIYFEYDGPNQCSNPLNIAQHLYLNGVEIKDLIIPNSVMSINNYTFSGWSGLTSVTIPNSVTSIGRQVFNQCSRLASVTISNSVTSIGYGAFYGTAWYNNQPDGLVYAGKVAYEYKGEMPANTQITIKDGTLGIADQTFTGCKGLTSVTIPYSVTSIGYSAFYGCSSLTTIVSEIEEPFGISSGVFSDDTYTVAELIVPKGTKALYQATEGWNKFTMINEVAESEPSVVLTAQNYSRGYGEANPVFEYTKDGGELNGTPTISCDATVTSPVGTYPIRISKGSVTNSNVTYVDGTLTITKAPLTITAKDCTREQGQENPQFEVMYSGFKNGETEAVLTRMPTVTTTATVNSVPGTYDIIVSGAEAQNYSFVYKKGLLTVTEKDEVTFSFDGVFYQGSKSEKSVKVKSVDATQTWIEIPVSVNYDGTTYQVADVADGAFDGCSMAALIWNVEAALPNNIFSNAVLGSNFLLYVKSSSYAPSSVKNVVVNGVAASVVLSDDGGQFYCPQTFTARSISYTHYYSMETGGNGKGWETIALPFDVQKISHSTRGEIVPFPSYSSGSTQKPFWLANFSVSGFRRTAAVLANEPYIIAMPNSRSYKNEYNLAGDVTFSADNVLVLKTPSLSGIFVPAFAPIAKSPSVKALNNASYSGGYDPGSRFIPNLRDVHPFEAYMTGSSSRGIVEINFDDSTTDMLDILLSSDESQEVTIHTLSGQHVTHTIQRDFNDVWLQLPKGIYIVNGKKWIK